MRVFIITWVDRALPNFRHFDDVVLNLRLDQHSFTSTSCLFSSLLPSSLRRHTKTQALSKSEHKKVQMNAYLV